MVPSPSEERSRRNEEMGLPEKKEYLRHIIKSSTQVD
jgi:hypothetical protein